MRLIFWFIVLPVLIASLHSKVNGEDSTNKSKVIEAIEQISPRLSEREARNLFSVLSSYVEDAQDRHGESPLARQDTADAITVSEQSIKLFL